ncbi:MAG TPA: hypothetical protein VL068_01140, partial [Microthrixaceae bacterium]|nr:hypothetical protein [Microthrixaceae bacterium]
MNPADGQRSGSDHLRDRTPMRIRLGLRVESHPNVIPNLTKVSVGEALDSLEERQGGRLAPS